MNRNTPEQEERTQRAYQRFRSHKLAAVGLSDTLLPDTFLRVLKTLAVKWEAGNRQERSEC